jgi:hypothetical protein
MSHRSQRYIRDTIQSCFCHLDSILMRAKSLTHKQEDALDISAVVSELGKAFTDSLEWKDVLRKLKRYPKLQRQAIEALTAMQSVIIAWRDALGVKE